MTDKEFRRMSRGKLIEYILSQSREIRQLEEELEKTEAQIRSNTVFLADTGDLSETGGNALRKLRDTQKKAERCLEALTRILSEKAD